MPDLNEAELVRIAAKDLAQRFPGRFIELRIPPYTAVQIGIGPNRGAHRRGKPPAVIEFTPAEFLAYYRGERFWQPKVDSQIDLSEIFHQTPKAEDHRK